MSSAKRFIRDLFAGAGVTVNGTRPWDIHVNNERLYARVLGGRNLGLGEAYMEGWWDCPRIDEFIHRVVLAELEGRVRCGLRVMARMLPHVVLNLQTLSRSRVVAEHHYDLGNDLFRAFLDPYLQYSCAYFDGVDDLSLAQRRKLRLICEKLELGPGHRLLDIGCGWGGLARYAAERYGCSVVGVNISRRQIAFAREYCRGLPVEIRECDYRLLDEPFDRIVSVGMFEHVGRRNYRTFFETVARCLEPDGIFLLHTIGSNESEWACDPWISKYIFPNGMLPSIARIGRASEGLFVMEDWHNLGPHYDRTLLCWNENFQSAWPELCERYGLRFRRMWEYYLQSCAGAFRARNIQLWQIVFTTMGRGQPRCRLA